jgi:hypothetical protein
MVEFDYEGGVPSICDIYELIISAHLFAFLLKFVDSCEEFSGPSSTGCVVDACSCHDCLGLTHAECGLYMFQKVHHVEEGAEVVVGAEAEKEEVVHPLTLVNLDISRDLRICVVIFIPVC